MNNLEPRYKTNLFISQEKHIFRTINTYLKYEKVKQIYLNYNFSKNKYQIYLKICEDDIIPADAMLMYDKEIVNIKLYDSSIIRTIITKEIAPLYKKTIIKKLIKYIIYLDNKKIMDNLYKYEDEVIKRLKKLFRNNQLKLSNDILAKRLYTTIKNKIYHINKSSLVINDVNLIEKNSYINIINELELLDYKLQNYINAIPKIEIYPDIDTYENLIIEIENYDNLYYKNTRDLNTLLEEINYFNSTGLNYSKTPSKVGYYENKITSTINQYYFDYFQINIYLENKNLVFTNKNLNLYKESLIQDIEMLHSLKGVKRRKYNFYMISLYGKHYKKYYSIVINNDEKNIFFIKQKLLHRLRSKYLSLKFIEPMTDISNTTFTEYIFELNKKSKDIFIEINNLQDEIISYSNLNEFDSNIFIQYNDFFFDEDTPNKENLISLYNKLKEKSDMFGFLRKKIDSIKIQRELMYFKSYDTSHIPLSVEEEEYTEEEYKMLEELPKAEIINNQKKGDSIFIQKFNKNDNEIIQIADKLMSLQNSIRLVEDYDYKFKNTINLSTKLEYQFNKLRNDYNILKTKERFLKTLIRKFKSYPQ